MRDSVNSLGYRALHGTEQMLHRALGDRYKTRYEMVSFSTIPYADIEATVRRQRTAAGLAAAVGVAALAWVGIAVGRR
jgi:kynurenine 3-monooxygenase